jgi:putative transposase
MRDDRENVRSRQTIVELSVEVASAPVKGFLRKALKRHGRLERIVIDVSQTNREAILSCDTTDQLKDQSRRKLKLIRIRQSAYLNNRIEQDHRAIKRRV